MVEATSLQCPPLGNLEYYMLCSYVLKYGCVCVCMCTDLRLLRRKFSRKS